MDKKIDVSAPTVSVTVPQFGAQCNAMYRTPTAEDERRLSEACKALAAPTPPTSAADAVDAARYRYIWSKVQAVSQNAFLLPHIKPVPNANLMRGSVADHFNSAIDAAIAASKESGDE